MSALSNAVHELLEVAAGRHNLTPEQADLHHLNIDDEAEAQTPGPVDPGDTEAGAGDVAQPEGPPAVSEAPGAAQPAAVEAPSGI